MFFKVPDGVETVSVSGQEYRVDEGMIEIENVTIEIEDTLRSHAGITRATKDEIEASGARASDRDEKALLIEQLKAVGVTADGRSSLASLQSRLEREAAKTPAVAKPTLVLTTKS